MAFAGWFGIAVGAGMIGQWLMSYFTHQIPELKSEPIRTGFHLAAELATALLLIISGILLLSQAVIAESLFLIGAGMLFYTCIVSPGYFAQRGQWGWLVMFGSLIGIGVIAILRVLG